MVDDEAGAYEAVKHLIKTGCRNIIHLSGPPDVNIGRNRKNGYIKALREFNLPVAEENIINCDTSGDAVKVVPRLLNRKEKPDGIFAVNDLTAAEAMKIVKHGRIQGTGRHFHYRIHERYDFRPYRSFPYFG